MHLEFKKRLASEVEKTGKKPATIAKELNINKSTFHNWLNQDNEIMPKAKQLKVIADGLNISLDYLITGNTLHQYDEFDEEIISIFKNLDERKKIEVIGIVKNYIIERDREADDKPKRGTGSGTQAV